jgi:hypothetical protein
MPSRIRITAPALGAALLIVPGAAGAADVARATDSSRFINSACEPLTTAHTGAASPAAGGARGAADRRPTVWQPVGRTDGTRVGPAIASVADRVRPELLAYAAAALEMQLALPIDAADSARREAARLGGEIATSIRRIELYAMQLDCLAAMEIHARRLSAFAMRPNANPGLRAGVYGLALGASVGANARFRIDTDAGGYRDTYWSQDKLFHFAAGYLLATQASMLRVPPRWSALLTCAGAAAFELSQRYSSTRDAVASCGGAVLGVLSWTRSRR